MSSASLGQIVIGDSVRDSIVIGYDAETISALHHALFEHFAQTGLGGRVTFHVTGETDVERHFFLTPERPLHFMYAQGKRPELPQDTVEVISTLLQAGEIVHIPLDQGTANDPLALAFMGPDAGPQET